MCAPNIWFTVSRAGESNGSLGTERLSHSLPGSPADRRPTFPEVVGSAESLVGRVSIRWHYTRYSMLIILKYWRLFSEQTLLLSGTSGAGSWQILWCWFCSLYISWDAGSFGHDPGGDGSSSTSALIAGTSRKATVLPDDRSEFRGGDRDRGWTWIRWRWSSLIAARPARKRASPAEFHDLGFSLHYQVPHLLFLLQRRLCQTKYHLFLKLAPCLCFVDCFAGWMEVQWISKELFNEKVGRDVFLLSVILC